MKLVLAHLCLPDVNRRVSSEHFLDSYHDEIALCYAQIGDHSKSSTAVFGDLEEFATPFQIVDAIYRLIITHTHNGAQGEYAEVQSFECRETVVFCCTASPQRFASVQERSLVEDRVYVMERSKIRVDEAAALRIPAADWDFCAAFRESVRLSRTEVRIIEGRQQSACILWLRNCIAMDLRETCHGRGAAIKLCASGVRVDARHLLLARCPR